MSTPSEEPTLHELLSRLAELEQAHARLQEELTHVRAARAPAAEEQTSAQTRTHPRRSSRRKVLEKGLGVAVATVGAGTLLELSSGTARASSTPKPGVFASSVSTTPAVKATGTSGADGVDATSDSGTGVSATSASGTGLVATSSSGLAGHFVGNVKLDNALTVAGTLSSGAGTFASSVLVTPSIKATGSNGADGVDASSDSGVGVFAQSSSSVGVVAQSSSGAGVVATSISSTGVFGQSSSGTGVSGFSGSGTGVRGKSTSGLAGFFEGNVTVTGTLSSGAGTLASSTAGTPAVKATGTSGADGVDATSDSGTGVSATSTSGTALVATSSSGLAGHFVGNVKLDNALTVAGTLSSGAGTFVGSASSTAAVKATGTSGADGLDASSNSGTGVFSNSNSGNGVVSNSISGNGVVGTSSSNNGVFGASTSFVGVGGSSSSSDGVFGFSGSGTGVHGKSTSGLAGFFEGNVTVTGTLSKGGGSFKIDHPLDPAHKYLSHSFVESPDMKNIYDGVVTLDANGEAEVTLPTWFDTLNTDFRYQLTALGNSAPDLYIAEKIRGNRFRIAGGPAGMEVSWMVTGTRQDAWANAYRIPVEQDKPAEEQGFYLHPELYEQLEQPHIMRARHPELPLPTGPR